MARQDQILVVDVESTCWEGPVPEGQVSEIIEVGVCLLDLRSLERSAKRSIMVRPARSSLSPFCTELTTIRPEEVERAGSLAEACRILEEDYLCAERPWASHGDYDRRQFQRNCTDLKVKYPFGPTHVNVKALFSLLTGAPATGMMGALRRLGLRPEGIHHRGDDDAWNIAALLAELLRLSRGAIRLRP